MRHPILCLFLSLPLLAGAQEDGWKSLFDGKTLEGWDGDPKFWTVEDGCLTGTTTEENPTDGNTFALWKGGEPGDFELKLQYKIEDGNSGIQYRSFKLPEAKDAWRVGGYQADIDSGDRYSGILYGEQFRGILADRGLITVIQEDGKPVKVGTLGDSDAIQAKINKDGWNDYHVIAKGFRFSHFINGVQTAESLDEDTDVRREKGLLALQLHAGPPMKVQFRNIQIKQLSEEQDEEEEDENAQVRDGDRRREVSLADEVDQLVVQVLPDGGYVLRTQPLTLEGLQAALGGVKELNEAMKVRVQAGGRRQNNSPESIQAARAAVRQAGVALQQRRGE